MGFYLLKGHGIPPEQQAGVLEQVRLFHALPLEEKEKIKMDRPEAIPGTGYLGMFSFKLPCRETSNANESLVLKKGNGVGSLEDNDWLDEVR